MYEATCFEYLKLEKVSKCVIISDEVFFLLLPFLLT